MSAAKANGQMSEENTTEKEAIEQTLKILVYTYGFDPKIAHEAIDAIEDKSDVEAAYNWILNENEVEDQGGPVHPKKDCPHVVKHIQIDVATLTEKNTMKASCGHYEESERTGGEMPTGHAKEYPFVDDLGNVTCPPGENWMCLECGLVRCSRYVNGHCMDHWEKTVKDGDDEGHCIAASFADLSVWCYKCESYIIHDSLDVVIKKLQELKFPDE